MVKLHTPEIDANRNPVMRPHTLTAIKKTKTFQPGETVECYITKWDDGRFSVFESSGAKVTRHYEVFASGSILHETFNES